MVKNTVMFSDKLATTVKKTPDLRIGVFGGSFDPIHNAHIQCALCAVQRLQLDALVIMPSYINPFKLSVATGVASAFDRVRMCKLAAREMRRLYRNLRKKDKTNHKLPKCRFEVSTWEIDQGESGRSHTSFTVETLGALRRALPEQSQLFYILGSDSAKELPSWHNSQELATLATFCVVKRPGVEWTEKDTRLLLRSGFAIELAEGPDSNVYSTDIRVALLEGADITGDMPKSVVRYIKKHELYAPLKEQDRDVEEIEKNPTTCVADSQGRGCLPLAGISFSAMQERVPVAGNISGRVTEAQTEDLAGNILAAQDGQTWAKLPLPNDAELTKLLKERVNAHRYAHVIGVANTARMLAQTYGIDQQKAYTAGLLHDWDKCFNDEEIRQRVKELGVSVELSVLRDMPQTLHGFTAAAYLRQTYDIDKDIAQAVERHTTGAIDMTPLDMCLYIADALEPNRVIPGVDALRGLVGKADLEDLFFEVYGYWMCLVIQRRRTVHPDSLIVWNTYALRYAQRHGLKFDVVAKSV